MKSLLRTTHFLAFSTILILCGCSHVTPNPDTGEGGTIDPTENAEPVNPMSEDNAGLGTNTGVVEEGRPAINKGIEKGKWDPIYFAFDSASVGSESRDVLETIAADLKKDSSLKILIEGHCDERGTLEYNRSLGQRRASATREYLVNLGASARQISTVSYGEEQPADPSHDESAWTKNRRCEFGIIR